MRIIILQGAFFPIPPLAGGAVEKMWFSLGKVFAQKGHTVIHISRQLSGLPDSEILDGVHYLRVKGYNTPTSGVVLKLMDYWYTLQARKLFSIEADIVISNTFWAPILLPKRYRQICMVDVQRMPKGQLRFYQHVVRLRANSTSVAAAIRQEIPATDHNKVIMIPNPLPFATTQSVDVTLKKPIILYAGRIHPEKGIGILIEAFKQVYPHFQLKIVGPWDIAAGGGGLEYVNRLRRQAGNIPIEFTGPIYDENQLNNYYKDASVFVYPSVTEQSEIESTPLEAMAWGCVPIVSSLACFRDFITDGVNGLVFDHCSDEAASQLAGLLLWLHQDDAFRQQLAQQALTVHQSHSAAHIADLFLAEFARIKG